MRYIMTVTLLSMLTLTGCAAVISEQSRKLVDSNAAFQTIKASPDNYMGRIIMLGGRIADIRNSSDGAQLEIVQFDLNSQGYPEDSFLSYGRFLATESRFMDPLIFKRGMLITVVGELKMKKTMRLDDMDYTYPVISMREWYLWPGSEADKGCSSYPVSPPQYNPYNYGPGYEPFLHRPYSPAFIPR